MKKNKEKSSKYEELANALVDITLTSVTKQEINTTAFYPVTLENNNDIEITIRKEEDKYKILQVDDKWKIIKKSNSNEEAEEILLTLTQIVIQLTNIIREIKQHNKQLKQINK